MVIADLSTGELITSIKTVINLVRPMISAFILGKKKKKRKRFAVLPSGRLLWNPVLVSVQ